MDPMAGRRPPLDQLTPRRIALLKPSALGDIVHALPVLSALRQRYPAAHLTWVVNRAYEPLLVGHPHLDETLPFDRSALRGGWQRVASTLWRFAGDLRRRRFDLVVDLQGLLRTGLMALASGAPRRVGLSSAREGSRWLYTDVVRSPDDQMRRGGSLHAVDRYWLVAEALGVRGRPTFHLPVAAAARQAMADLLRPWPRPWLMLGLGSRWLTKRWPPHHFAALTARAQARWGGTAVFVGAPEEAELARTAATQLSGPKLDLSGRTTLPQLAALLAVADVVLANDTGPLHLAVALGRPVVAPYTCTQTALTGPYAGTAGGAVSTTVWCAGSYRRHCDRMECMTELTPDRLWPLLEKVMLSWPCRSQSA
jgi:heptosyltransferase-1